MDMTTVRDGPDLTVTFTFDQYILAMVSCCGIYVFLSTFGIITNLISIRTFAVIGLKDAMTVSFMLLSTSDLMLSVVSLAMGIGGIFYSVEFIYDKWFTIDPYIIGLFTTNLFIPCSAVVALNTSFVSLARCACVSLPFYFKHIFKRKTSIVFMSASFVFCAVTYTPVFVYMAVVERYDTVHNRSRPTVWVSPDRKYVKDFVWNILGMAIPLSTQAIIIASTIIMTRALTKSQKFRSANAQSYQHAESKTIGSLKISETTKLSSGKLTGKDRQVVKQVVVISLVYILCNTPKIIFILATVFVSDLNLGGRFSYLYITVSNIRIIFEIINSATSLLINYSFNSKFRNLCGIQSYICVFKTTLQGY